MSYYCLHDYDLDLKKKGAFRVKKEELSMYNELGYGCHWSPNKFKGRWIAENLEEIRFWLCDIDDGTKEEMMYSIKALPVKPTIIVETKKGYHCYWKVEGMATVENYKAIQAGLIKQLNGDPACKDVTRMLRMPAYLHQKNPDEPFMVKVIENNGRTHTENKMLLAYRIKESKPKIKRTNFESNKEDFFDESKFELLYKVSSIGEGGRNNDLARIRLWLKDEGFCGSDIYNIISRINDKISNPLDQREIRQICRM